MSTGEHHSAPQFGHVAGEHLATLAARLLSVATGQVSLVTTQPLTIAKASATPLDEQSTIAALCRHVALTGEPLSLPGPPQGHFAATLLRTRCSFDGAFLGVPLIDAAGPAAGALCVFDPGARTWSPQDISVLEHIALAVLAEVAAAHLRAQWQDSQVIFGLAVGAAGIGTQDWDLLSQTVVCSEQLLGLFDFPPGTSPRPIADFSARIHPDDLALVDAALRTAAAQHVDYEVDYRLLLPSGAIRWLSTRGRLLRNEDDRAVRLLGASYDITASRDADGRVTRVLEAMPAGFLSMDRQWRFTYINPTAEQLLGQTRAELLGGVLWEVYPATVDSIFERAYRTAVDTDTPVTFQAFYPAPLDAWYEILAWPTAEGLSLYFLNITERITAEQLAEQAAARNALLAQVSQVLLTATSSDHALDTLAPLLVPALADWCIFTVLEGDGRDHDKVRDVGGWHADPACRPLVARYGEVRREQLPTHFPVREVLRTGQVWTGQVTDATGGASTLPPGTLPAGEAKDLIDRLDPASCAFLPLRSHGHTIGVLSLFNGTSRGPHSPTDLATASDVTDRVGLSLDNARLSAQQRHLSEELQRSLLSEPSCSPELAVAVRYLPAATAAQVGGDWYDAFTERDGDTLLVIGDVVGHDATAAATMGQIRALLRGIAMRTGDSPAQILCGVDEVLAKLQVETTATVIVMRVRQDPTGGPAALCWSNAGHPPPILLLPDGTARALERPEADLMLGIDPGTQRTEHTESLVSGSTVALYTDGLVERRGHSLESGLAALQEALLTYAYQPVEQLCDSLIHDLVAEYTEDDIALMVLRPRR